MAMENDKLLQFARTLQANCKANISNEDCNKCIFYKKHFYDFCKLGKMDIDEDIYLFPCDWEV